MEVWKSISEETAEGAARYIAMGFGEWLVENKFRKWSSGRYSSKLPQFTKVYTLEELYDISLNKIK